MHENGLWTHFQPSTCLQASTSGRVKQDRPDSDPGHCMTRKKKIQCMLVCMAPGVIVLISRHEDLNSAELEFLVPWVLWENAGIACCALNQWGSFNWPRSKPCGQRKASESSDGMCMNFRVRGIRPRKHGSQAQSQKRESQPNGSMQSISMEPAMSRHIFM